MNNVIYRDLNRDDYCQVKSLIDKAFKFSEFIKNKNVLDSILNIYLQSCILDSSFSKVALKDNEVIGIILGNANRDHSRLKKFHNTFSSLCSISKLVLTNREDKKIIKQFLKIDTDYKELIEGRKGDFQGTLNLLIVSENSRNLGVGKTLLKYLFDYMQTFKVESFYLYTDNRCNYKFYNKQNFKCIDIRKISFNSSEIDLIVFLYSYDL